MAVLTEIMFITLLLIATALYAKNNSNQVNVFVYKSNV